MTPRRRVENELSRKAIMDSARKLFVRQGYQHVSMRQLAKELSYSHGAIYYHFKNKAELFYALVEEDFELLNQSLEEILALDLPAQEKLQQILLGYIAYGLNNQNHYEIMFLIKDEELTSLMQEGPNKSYEKFAQAIASLSDFKIGIREIWFVFLSLHGFVTHYCRSGQTFNDVQDLAGSHVNMIIKGIQ